MTLERYLASSLLKYKKTIARLNRNGDLDESFDFAGSLLNRPGYVRGEIHDLLIQSDDKILVSGNFTGSIHSGLRNWRNSLMRINANGGIDSSFLQHCAGNVSEMLFYDG